MEERLSGVIKLIIELFKDPEQTQQIVTTAERLRGMIDSLEADVLKAHQTKSATSIFDELPTNSEAESLRALVTERDMLKAKVLRNRLDLALTLAQLRRES